MSGGLAYVLDERGDFEDRCLQNANVDVEPFEAEADIEMVRDMIKQHVAYTRSPKGEWILEHWESMVPRFQEGLPARTQARPARARAEGRDPLLSIGPVRRQKSTLPGVRGNGMTSRTFAIPVT